MKPETTRRAVVAGLAAAPVAGLPALATVSSSAVADPIFAAIDRHKAAHQALNRICSLTDEILAEEEGREVTDADWVLHDAASDAEIEALETLIETAPTSKAGARAAIEWLVRYDSRGEDARLGEFAMTLLRSPVLTDVEARS